MARKKPSEMGLRELMGWLGESQPGSPMRPIYEAEYERRKFTWQRIAVVIAGIGVFVGLFGVIIGAAHLGEQKSSFQPPPNAQSSN
jgi:hypothetical protein